MWLKRIAGTLRQAYPSPPTSIGYQRQISTLFTDYKLERSKLLGEHLDLVFSRISSLNGSFFSKGWGDLSVVDFEEDIKTVVAWPPAELQIPWKKLGNGEGFKLYEGEFRTPCSPRVYNFLPEECRTARVRLLVASAPFAPTPAPGHEPLVLPGPSGVVHLAATGDHGFDRRLRLGQPIAKQGVSSMVLESPYYGKRRPKGQSGAKLRHVSDLLALGWATITESIHLLKWLQDEGHTQLGVSGLSMGGVHACMTAGLCPTPVAATALLAPRSAAVAYCDGAMARAMSWHGLQADHERHMGIESWVGRAAQATPFMPAGLHALQALEAAAARQACSGSGSSSGTSGNGSTSSDGKQQPQVVVTQRSGAATKEVQDTRDVAAGEEMWREMVARLLPAPVRRMPGQSQQPVSEETVGKLKQVLETYTDVTRYPRPQRPDAGVFVCATGDAYVSRESVMQMHCYWPGSEVRFVSGGHVSAFFMHQGSFRAAILDSLARLERPGFKSLTPHTKLQS